MNAYVLQKTLILMIYLASVAAYFKLTSPRGVFAIMIGVGAGLFILFGLYASGMAKIQQALLLLLTGLVFRLKLAQSKAEPAIS